MTTCPSYPSLVAWDLAEERMALALAVAVAGASGGPEACPESPPAEAR